MYVRIETCDTCIYIYIYIYTHTCISSNYSPLPATYVYDMYESVTHAYVSRTIFPQSARNVITVLRHPQTMAP